METLHNFEIAGASVTGTTHLKRNMNNQDHFLWIQTSHYLIAIVSDGCGSTKYSEVGSKLLSNITANYLAKYLDRSRGVEGEKLFRSEQWWRELRQDVLTRIRMISQEMGENWWEILKDHFLATLLGVVIREDSSCIFSCGDGIFALNGDIQQIGPFEGNKPPYLVYGLTGSEITNQNSSLLDFQQQLIFPTAELQTLMLGTDGVEDLVKLSDQPFPAKEKLIGNIDQFWSEDIYFTNPNWMKNVLTTINTEKKRVNWEQRDIVKYPGLLPDDTTLITLRKKEA